MENVEYGKTEYGVLPIENSSSGSINDVLDIVQMMKARIVGELFYPIDHSLLTVNGGTLEEITEIYSHPQPVTQCSNWLNLHLPNVKIHYTSASSEAMKEVKKAVSEGKPFYLNLAHYAVHTPFETDERFINNYPKGEKKDDARAFATLIEGMDKSLGDLMDNLEKMGIAEKLVSGYAGA